MEAHHQLEVVVHAGELDGQQVSVNLGDGAVDQIHQLIDQMYAPVEQHAAARFTHTAPVAGNAFAALHAGFDVKRLSDGAVLDQLLDHQEILVPAAVLVHGELPSRLLGNGDNLLQLGRVHHHGLFADHVLARPHGLDGQRLVEVVRHSEDDGADLRVGEQRVERLISVNAVLFRGIDPLGVDIINTGKAEFLRQGEKLLGMPAAHAAVADDCNRIHERNFLSDSGWEPPARNQAQYMPP